MSLRVEGAVATITLDRPEVLNALSVELLTELRAELRSAAQRGARAAVLTGAGTRAFSAGADLKLVLEAQKGDRKTALAPLIDTLHDLLRDLRASPFPVVAAVEGLAVGAGLGLALAADLRVIGGEARFLPGYFGIGASPDGGVSYFLTRALGSQRAAAVILQNRELRAEEIMRLGLADEVVADGTAQERAREVAESLTGTPPLALVRLRELVDRATVNGFSAQLDLERRLVAELWETEDLQEGVSAFVERRRPRFKGA